MVWNWSGEINTPALRIIFILDISRSINWNLRLPSLCFIAVSMILERIRKHCGIMYDVMELLEELLQSGLAGLKLFVCIFMCIGLLSGNWVRRIFLNGISLVEELGHLKYICLSSHLTTALYGHGYWLFPYLLSNENHIINGQVPVFQWPTPFHFSLLISKTRIWSPKNEF